MDQIKGCMQRSHIELRVLHAICTVGIEAESAKASAFVLDLHGKRGSFAPDGDEAECHKLRARLSTEHL